MGAMNLIGLAGLASAWMLLWGAAAAIPIVLHLLNRRRQQTVSWAAMRLLMQVIEKQSKRSAHRATDFVASAHLDLADPWCFACSSLFRTPNPLVIP